MIVWRETAKIIVSVLYSIVCNSCAQCSAHIWTDRTQLFVGYCVLQFICVKFSFLGLFCVI